MEKIRQQRERRAFSHLLEAACFTLGEEKHLAQLKRERASPG